MANVLILEQAVYGTTEADAMQLLLEGRGHTVTRRADTVPAGDLSAFDVVVVADTARAASLDSAYWSTNLGVFAYSSGHWGAGYLDVSSSSSAGVNQTSINVVDAAHPIAIAAGLTPGMNTVVSSAPSVSRVNPGGLAPGAARIADFPTSPDGQAVLWAVEAGAELLTGNAPGRRVGFGHRPSTYTPLGEEVFFAAINWLIGAPSGLDPITDLSAQAGNGSVSLSWTPPTGATSQQLHRALSSPVPEDGSAALGLPLSGTADQTTDITAVNGVTYYYKVSATDGEATVYSNEVSATPQAPPPTATITNPAGNVVVSPGVEIVLEGTAEDGNGDPLTGEDLVWESDVDGSLGTGTSITAVLSGSNDSPVAHTITLTATQADEQTATDTVTVTVGISGSGVTRTRRMRSMAILYQYDPIAARRRVPLYLEDATGAPVTGESGTPQFSVNGGAFAATTAALTEVGNGHYYVELTAAELSTLGKLVVRYRSQSTIECVTICDVVPLVAIASGSVSSATDARTFTVDAGLTLPAGSILQIVSGAGAGGAGIVQSYDVGTGAVVLEAPGLPTAPDATTRFVAYAAPRPGLEIDASGRVAADVEAVAGSEVSGVADFRADVSGLATSAALSAVANNITAILEDTGTTIPAQIANLNDLSAAEVRAAVGLASANLDTQLGAIPTLTELQSELAGAVSGLSTFDPEVDTVSVATISQDVVDAIWSRLRSAQQWPAGSFGDYLDAKVSNAGAGSGGDSAAVIADAVWSEAIADHSGQSGSAAAAIQALENLVNQILANTGTDLPSALVTLQAIAEAIKAAAEEIKAKTDQLTFTAAGSVDANIRRINSVEIKGDGSTMPWGP